MKPAGKTSMGFPPLLRLITGGAAGGAAPACRRAAGALVLALAVIALSSPAAGGSPPDSARHRQARMRMVEQQLVARDIRSPEVLSAMRSTPRHWFVPPKLEKMAYADRPLPIGDGQTISQPYIVALMTELLEPAGDHRVLEIGTGSGYQAAVLSAIVKKVYTVEIKPGLYQRTRDLLQRLSYTNIVTRHADGYFGWEEQAPFDGIMITASVDHVPPPLIRQLAEGGRLVLPLGNPFSYQNLVVVTKENGDVRLKQITGVLFVPMTGRALEGSPQ